MSKFLGIDVGLTGALGLAGEEPEIYDMPTYTIARKSKGVRHMLDERSLWEMMKSIRKQAEWAVIERQQPFAKQGLVSTFNLGAQYGLIRGYLIALDFRFQTISPQTWQKVFSIVKKPNTKYASYEKASALFPKLKLQTERGRILDGRCDAILIAEYGRRLFTASF